MRALAMAFMAGALSAANAEAAAPPGQWWNAAYAERMNVVVTGRGTAAPTQYSLSVTIDHARMVSTGRSLPSGNDVRVVYWNGGGWVELDRRLDDQSAWNNASTRLWFRTQTALGALAANDNYYIYFGNAAAGAPPSNWANVFLFYDDFNAVGLDTTTRWTACTGTCTQSGGGTLDLNPASRVWAQPGFSFGYDTRWEARQQLVAPYANLNHWGAANNDGYCCVVGDDWVVMWHDGSSSQWETANGGVAGLNFGPYANALPASFNVYTFDREGSSSVRFWLEDPTANRTEVHNQTTALPNATLRPRLENVGGGASRVITDWVRVRNYVTPEPEATARRETTTLNGSCMVVTDVGGGTDAGRSVALQSDGKIVVGGDGYVDWEADFVVARYNGDFRLDTAFGGAGLATTNVDYKDEARGVAIQPDGKIVLGGHDRVNVAWSNDDFAVVRYNPDGSLDTASFNPGGGFGGSPNRAGTVATGIGASWDLGRPLVLQVDGKMVVAGPVDVGGQYDMGVARYNTDGSPDSATFGAGTGKVITPVGALGDWGNALVVKADPGGYILLAGASTDTPGFLDYDFSMVRYNLDGTLDGSFGVGGKVRTDLRGAMDWGASVVVQPDGKIVMAGGSSNGVNTDFAVVRYNANGTLDTSFGTGGMVFTPIGPADDDPGGVALQPDGKIVVVGSAQNGANYDFAVVRYNANGSLDTSFGTGGKVTTPIRGGDDSANAVVLQPDGRIVVAGESYNTLTQDTDLAMVRYEANGAVDLSCGQVFYSVGTNPANLATGSPSLSLVSGTATLSASQTNNVGVGDVIDYGSGQVFISAVVSPTQFRVQTATGNLPVDFSGPVTSITRAFNSISDAVTGSVDASHLNTSNLVTLEKGLTWVCYDDGPFAEAVTIDGYTTNASYFATLTVAGAGQVASGVSQRHAGTAATGVVVRPASGDGIRVQDNHVVVEWLDVDGSAGSTGDGINPNSTATHLKVRNCLVHDFMGTNSWGIRVEGDNTEIRNTVVYNISPGGTFTYCVNFNNCDNNSIYNSTLYNCDHGLAAFGSSGNTVENVLSVGHVMGSDFVEESSGFFNVFNNSISSDATADDFGGVGNLINRAAAAQFISLAPVNLHLRGGADAIDAGKNLAASFNDDINGNPRPQGAAWDVGADESFLSGAATNYRSIGPAANLVNQGTITITAGSVVVTKSGGLGWRAQNRGRGDVLIAGGTNYMIAGVVNDDMLTLATLPTAPFSGGTYTIARQFDTLAEWEACIDGQGGSPPPAAPCFYFPAPSASLVADDRSEVGIAYNDVVGADLAGGLTIDDSVTDATHTITLTADGVNRHYGLPGQGVLINNGASVLPAVMVFDDFVTVEWMEITGGGGSADGIRTNLLSAGAGSLVTLRNNLIHNVTGDGIALFGGDGRVDVYNNISYANSTGLYIDFGTLAPGSRFRILNNTFYGNTGVGGVFKPNGPSAATVLLRNNISVFNNPGTDYICDPLDSIDPASGNNLDEDSSGGTGAGTHNPAGGSVTSSVAGLLFVNAAGGNLHIGSGSTAANVGADLSAVFGWDIDNAPRTGAWDIGADEFGATTAVKLQSFSAAPGDGTVMLAWRTASELDNLGFHVYRGLSGGGPWTRLNASLIPGLGSSPVGQSYSFRDAGLQNGTRYFYRLEDVDASSKATSHGPVSAVPQAGTGEEGSDTDAAGSRKKDAAASGCPAWVLAALGSLLEEEAASLRCTRHGDPEASSLAVLSRDERSATLELRTGGFYALHEAAGTVRVFVPDFDFPQDERAAALPIRRALVDAVVGRRVQLAGVRALELQGFRGLVPSALGKAEMQVGQDGTVRAKRRATPSHASARVFPKRELVTLLPSEFQGEKKSAVVEIAPLRYDGQRRQLVLAKRVRLRLLFTGREVGESGRGSLGRAPRLRQPAVTGEVLAWLHTTSPGLHAVAFEQLFPAWRRGLTSSGLRLERQGEPVPFHLEPATGTFGPGSRLYFHADASASSTDFAAEVAYALVSSREGVPMPVESAAPGSPAVSTAPVATRSFEVNRFYQPGLLEAEDLWLWEALASGATRALGFSLTGVDASGSAELDVFLQGASESGRTVDHHVSVSLNGVPVGEAQFAGKRPYRMTLSLPASLLREGANQLSLTSVADTGATSFFFLDRFSLSHPQLPVLASGVFEGTWADGGAASVSGLSSAAAVVDVTTGGAARWLTGYEVANGSLRFQAAAGHRYLVVSAPASPRVAAPERSTLRVGSNQADYVLIAPRAFLPAAEPLLLRRQDQGLKARAVAFEEIAAEFGHGRPSAEAIRSFLAYAFHSWTRPSPRYVMLLGDASYDPRNFSGVSQPSPLPALWSKTSYLWTVSDPLLAAVNGEDSLPDLAIGRLPATTLAQAEALVRKLVAWEESGQGLAGPAALVADNPDLAGDFEADVRDIGRSFLAERSPRLLLLGQLGAGTRPAILDALDTGLSYLSYVGHGGAAVWASENVWNSWDAASLREQSQQPLLLTLNCLNGYFVAPAYDSLSESLLKVEGRGAIASVSPSGLSLDGPAHQYHRALMQELTAGGHDRLGDALLAAQRAYAQTGLMPELLTVYHLLGDPATPIR